MKREQYARCKYSRLKEARPAGNEAGTRQAYPILLPKQICVSSGTAHLVWLGRVGRGVVPSRAALISTHLAGKTSCQVRPSPTPATRHAYSPATPLPPPQPTAPRIARIRVQVVPAVQAVQAVQAVKAVQAVQAVKAVQAVQAVHAVQAVQAMQAVQSVQAV